MCSGTWFYFIGVILYPPHGYHGLKDWNQSSHKDMMIVTNFFGLNIMGVLVFQVFNSIKNYDLIIRKLCQIYRQFWLRFAIKLNCPNIGEFNYLINCRKTWKAFQTKLKLIYQILIDFVFLIS